MEDKSGMKVQLTKSATQILDHMRDQLSGDSPILKVSNQNLASFAIEHFFRHGFKQKKQEILFENVPLKKLMQHLMASGKSEQEITQELSERFKQQQRRKKLNKPKGGA